MNRKTACILILVFGLVFSMLLSCGSESDESASTATNFTAPTMQTPTAVPSPTLASTPTSGDPTATPTPRWPPFTPSPTEPSECEADRQMIQAAVDAYHEETGVWPTSGYEIGEINWVRLIPDWMDERPVTERCEWTINSDPLGQVCRAKHC